MGVWIGGLAALLIGLRGMPSAEKAAAIRRFAIIAAVGLAVVVATGIARAVSELHSWSELVDTGYGRAVLVKLALVTLIAVIADRNRRRGVPLAATDLRPLRRMSRAELALAVIALGVAGLLGTLAPPVSGQTSGLVGLSASGSDTAGTVRASLTALSNQPGSNSFAVRLKDRSGHAVGGASVSLLFSPLDDPGVASSSLALSPASAGTYTGSGPNMTFDGRWGVRVLIARGGDTAEVPLELDPIGPPERISIERIVGQAPTYTTLVGIAGFIRISPQPERAGHSRLDGDVLHGGDRRLPAGQARRRHGGIGAFRRAPAQRAPRRTRPVPRRRSTSLPATTRFPWSRIRPTTRGCAASSTSTCPAAEPAQCFFFVLFAASTFVCAEALNTVFEPNSVT